jgi:ABC-type multidrug transport system fused ATPase/permease subunit
MNAKEERSLTGFFRATIGTLCSYAYGKENRLPMSAVHSLSVIEVGVRIFTEQFIISLISNEMFGSSSPKDERLPWLCLAGVVVNLALPRIRNLLMYKVKGNIQQAITQDMVKQIYDGELNELLGQPTGKPAAIISKNYGSVQNVVPILVTDLLQVVIGTFGISVVLSSRYGGVGSVPILVLMPYLVGAVLGEIFSLLHKINNQGIMVDSFDTLLKVIKNYTIAHQYGNRDLELSKLDAALSKLDGSFQEMHRLEETTAVILGLISKLGLFGAMTYVMFCPPKPHFGPADFLLFGYFLLRSNMMLDTLPKKISDLFTGLADTHLIVDFFKSNSTIADPKNPIQLNLTRPPKVEFRNVNFSYGEGKAHLHNISFTLEPGKKLAIMGTTGSGKSTLLKLLQRFYEFTGEILINDLDIRSFRKEDLRRYFSVVAQETTLVTNSLFDSIKYGDRTASDNDVLAAARFAKLQFPRVRFFADMQQDGANFSGGEKQRANVARALLKRDSRMFLLDEPTSSLDQQTARDMCEILDQLTEDSTTIMVTHDPNAVIHADLILYMQNGRIIEEGRFDMLMRLQGAFYQQFMIQCNKLGILPQDIKPMQRAKSDENGEFISWRNRRRSALFQPANVENQTEPAPYLGHPL